MRTEHWLVLAYWIACVALLLFIIWPRKYGKK